MHSFCAARARARALRAARRFLFRLDTRLSSSGCARRAASKPHSCSKSQLSKREWRAALSTHPAASRVSRQIRRQATAATAARANAAAAAKAAAAAAVAKDGCVPCSVCGESKPRTRSQSVSAQGPYSRCKSCAEAGKTAAVPAHVDCWVTRARSSPSPLLTEIRCARADGQTRARRVGGPRGRTACRV